METVHCSMSIPGPYMGPSSRIWAARSGLCSFCLSIRANLTPYRLLSRACCTRRVSRCSRCALRTSLGSILSSSITRVSDRAPALKLLTAPATAPATLWALTKTVLGQRIQTTECKHSLLFCVLPLAKHLSRLGSDIRWYTGTIASATE